VRGDAGQLFSHRPDVDGFFLLFREVQPISFRPKDVHHILLHGLADPGNIVRQALQHPGVFSRIGHYTR
jgi:hypothetical protein